jgi:uncharacterized RDD family membrane protein YckC
MSTPSITLQSITGVDVELRIAGPGSRSYAFVIDWHIRFILALAWFFATLMIYGGSLALLDTVQATLESFWLVVIVPSSVIYLLYHPILEVLMQGRTPGKRMAGVRLVSRSGDVPGVGALLVRNVFRIVDSLPFFYIVGLVTVMFTQQHVRVGDLAAGTLLVLDETEHDGSLARLSPAAHARGLDPKAVELAQELLDRWKSLDDETRSRIARSLLVRLEPNAAAATLATERSAALRARLEALLAPGESA